MAKFWRDYFNWDDFTDKNGYHIADIKNKHNEEDVITDSSIEQTKVELFVDDCFKYSNDQTFHFQRDKHINYVLKQLHMLPAGYSAQEASRTWLCFWMLHSLNILNYKLTEAEQEVFILFLKRCQATNGGYGGGPGQYPHMATTYAAVMSLVSIGTEKALDSIDRKSLLQFFQSVKEEDGSFRMHVDGEVDVRAVYCSLAVCFILNIYTDKLFENTGQWVASCQSYEGGFSGEPHCESHGGYTFCGAASLLLLNKVHLMDVNALARWVSQRQMPFEGGFQGRTGKLVDACYSYWVGAAAIVAEDCLSQINGDNLTSKAHFFNPLALQQYIVFISQHQNGGFKDKPRKPTDLYHTCYALAGLAIAQAYQSPEEDLQGGADALLKKINVLYNLCEDKVEFAENYFQNPPNISPNQNPQCKYYHTTVP